MRRILRHFLVLSLLAAMFCVPLSSPVMAAAPSAGGDTTVVNPVGEGAVSINEDAVQPESANIRLIVGTLSDSDGGTPGKIRIITVVGGTLWDSAGSSITLGTAGTTLSLSSGRVDLRFRPDSNRDSNASFTYTVVDVQDETINSSASTATIPITAVNDVPILQTTSGNIGTGLAATYYINSWDLTGTTYSRVDSTVNFSNNFDVPGYNAENFSVRWTGQVRPPVTGSYTFSTISDDGIRLWINDVMVIDNWTLHGSTVDTASPVTLTGGTLYSVKMEFYERGGAEVAVLRWSYPGQGTQVIPQASLFPGTSRPELTYVIGASSAVIDDALTISDVDSTTMSNGSVVISSGYNSDEDSLLFTNQNGISGSYSNGTLSLSGVSSMTNWRDALRSVRYRNSSATPDTSTRTVTFKVNDGHDDSNSTFRNIAFSGTNTAPVITTGTSTGVTMDRSGSPIPFALTLTATDVENQSIHWRVSGDPSHGSATATGTGNSIDVSYTPTADYTGTDSFIVEAADELNATDTITVNVTIVEHDPPVISNVAAQPSGTGAAIITWTTNESGSSLVRYGLSSIHMTATSETNTSPRVTSHSRTISSLRSCTTYQYEVVSRDVWINTATGSVNTFTTGGCAGDADVATATGTSVISNANGSTGSIVLPDAVSIVVPSGFIASNATCPTGAQFQLKTLSTAPVRDSLGVPSGKDTIVNALDLSAYCPDTTRVTTFDQTLTLTFSYQDSDVTGLDESSLGVYRWGSGSTFWEPLTCTVSVSTNEIVCETTHFSSFGVFGSSVTASSAGETVTTTQSGGCRGTACRSRAPVTLQALMQLQTQTHAAATSDVSQCSLDTLSADQDRLLIKIDGRATRFGDVPTSAWFACHVQHVVGSRIFDGYRDMNGELLGLYGPSDSITMGQLAKIALRLAKANVPPAISGEDWYAPFVREAKTFRLTSFKANVDAAKPATRGVVITTLLEVLHIPTELDNLPYADVPLDSPDAPAISTATRLGIVSGDDGSHTFRPDAPINRAEVAKMIVLALEKHH